MAGDTLQLLRQFEAFVEGLAKHEERARDPKDVYDRLRLGAVIQGVFDYMRRHGAYEMFLDVLREYAMVPKDRKIVERAAKTFAKSKVNRIKEDKAVEVFIKTLDEYRLFAATVRRVLTSGSKHSEEGGDTVLEAGPFQLINTGGFAPAAMADVAKVVEKSVKLLHSKGLARICYGSIQVTNSVGRSTRVLAFYRPSDDTLYIRANLKGKQGPAVLSVTHELGHRLHKKFLQSKNSEIHGLYSQLAHKKQRADLDLLKDRSKWPSGGETITENGVTYVVKGVSYKGKSPVVELAREADPSRGAHMDLGAFIGQKHPETSVFVSPYAATTPEENFAEMIAYYCEDLLPDDQVAMLEAIL